MATNKANSANYVRTRPPHKSREYFGYSVNVQGIKIVTKALSKFCTGEEIEIIKNGYRRSEFSQEALLDDFWKADVKEHHVIKDTYYYQALSLATELLLPKYKWRPVHFADLRWYNFPLSVSAEAPFTSDEPLRLKILEAYKKGELNNTRVSFHNAYNYIFVKCRNWVHMIKNGVAKGNQLFWWITLHARSHLVTADEEDKIRMVYGVPKLLIFTELMFLWPLFNWLRNNESPIAWGYETLSGGFYKLMNLVGSCGYTINTWLCLDWKSFDKRARFSVIDDVHNCFESGVEFSKGYIPTVNYPVTTKDMQVFETQMRRLFKWMRNAVKFTPIRLFDGSEYKRTHSNIASGLLSTQLLDTWVNFIMLVTCLLSMGYQIDEKTIMKLLGDDSILGLREIVPEADFSSFLERFADEAYRRFGAIVNIKKSMLSRTLNGCGFLGYVCDNGIPKRDYLKLLAQLLYPERGWDLSKLAARSIGIAYASAGQSELVYNVCKDVYEYIRSLGHEPDPSGMQYLEYQGISVAELDLATFPTRDEIYNQLLSVNPTITTEYMNKSVFLEEF